MLQTPLIFLIEQRGERQDVEEQQRRSHRDRHRQLRGVILVRDSNPVLRPLPQRGLRGLRGPSLGARVAGAAGGPSFGEALGVGERGVVLEGGAVGEGGDGLEELVDVVEVRDQLKPEGDLGGAVVVADAGLEADVEVELFFRRVLGPGHLLEAVGFGVDELGILGYWLVGVTAERDTRFE